MPKPKKPTKVSKKDPFTHKGIDLMGGPAIRTRPSDTRPIFIPQRRLNVGMDRWPT
jgi:hypothetical protein